MRCTSFSSCRRRNSLFTKTTPVLGHHYAIDQPGGAEPGAIDGIAAGKDHENLDARESIRLSYFYPEWKPLQNQNDHLYDERHVSHKPHPDTDDGHIVTVEIRHGDCFNLDMRSGLWRFVGVHVDNPQKMLFAPADEEARDSGFLDHAYTTYYRSDFAHKLAGLTSEWEITRVRPELGDNPSIHAKPAAQVGDYTPEAVGIAARIRAFLSLFRP